MFQLSSGRLGFLTPFAGGLAAFANLVAGIWYLLSASPDWHEQAFISLSQLVMSLALVLLGPGAFSLDAYMFGRREIIIPESPRPPDS
jgi:uncharacterized membrane protein YphA (DoxX/SURF4 family)